MNYIIVLDFILFFCSIYLYFQYSKAKAKTTNDRILFSFCDLRRELMTLARENKVNTHSEGFKLVYKFLSDMIRCTRGYRFLSESFLDSMKEEDDNIKRSDVQQKIMADFQKQGSEAEALMNKFIKTMIDAILLTDPLFMLKYNRVKKLQNQKKIALYSSFANWERPSLDNRNKVCTA